MKTQIRNNPGMSSYFQGKFQSYGMYQWNIKFYGFQSESEIETALSWAFGEHVQVGKRASNGNTLRGFETISELVGRPVESHTAGRSGGWLVIDTELTDAELEKIDSHVAACMSGVAEFLKSERKFQIDTEKEMEDRAALDLKNLQSDPKIKRVLKILDEMGMDYSLNVDGIKLV